MTHGDVFFLAADSDAARVAAERLFDDVKDLLTQVLTPSSDILHVGATAIPGCLTKGDLDIVVRVNPVDFAEAEIQIAKHFARNEGSIRTAEFAAFEAETLTPHLGLQLTSKGSAFDFFHRFAEALRTDPDLVRRYNDLKLAYQARPMADYRAAKDAFIAEALRLHTALHGRDDERVI
jgi:GrpB-like predicted nucleotidyltransferase (UPF0157 family)